MSTSETRQRLINVARSLFAHKGLEATTMNDIATASGRGRRTLYTYFRSKEEIYYAVIEEELSLLTGHMNEVAAAEKLPEEKLYDIIYAHLMLIKETVARNGTLRAEFFRNIWMVEKVRRAFDEQERKIICRVLQEGLECKRFQIEYVELTADIVVCCLKGLEVPYIYDRLGEGLSDEEAYEAVKKLIFRAIGLQTNNETTNTSINS